MQKTICDMPYECIKKILATPKKITISTHYNPDGDALGSSLALFLFLKKQGHTVKVVLPNAYPHYYAWMPSIEKTYIYSSIDKHLNNYIQGCDVLFCLDYNTMSRTRDMQEVLSSSKAQKILIDHHLFPDVFDYSISDTQVSSTCELIYDFILKVGGDRFIDSSIATCIYVGILTDTGQFQFSCTTAHTHRIIANLIEQGIFPNTIHDRVYNCFNEKRLRFYGYAIKEKLFLVPKNNQIAYFSISMQDQAEYGIQEGDTEGLVNYALKISDVKMVAFFKESYQKIKISFRSKENYDVNQIASKHFNGGGHLNASGGMSTLSLEKTVQKFIHLF